eukprot:5471776-Amphidinium_carterae.1
MSDEHSEEWCCFSVWSVKGVPSGPSQTWPRSHQDADVEIIRLPMCALACVSLTGHCKAPTALRQCCVKPTRRKRPGNLIEGWLEDGEEPVPLEEAGEGTEEEAVIDMEEVYATYPQVRHVLNQDRLRRGTTLHHRGLEVATGKAREEAKASFLGREANRKGKQRSRTREISKDNLSGCRRQCHLRRACNKS